MRKIFIETIDTDQISDEINILTDIISYRIDIQLHTIIDTTLIIPNDERKHNCTSKITDKR